MNRWCLSGTPIQNSMEDLRALLQFIQLDPFTSRSIFERTILQPIQSDPEKGTRYLRVLLGAVCLRRGPCYIDLPPGKDEQILVPLHHDEIEEQSHILNGCKEQFEQVVSRKSSLKKYSILFSTILKLRRLCSHGTLRQDMLLIPQPTWGNPELSSLCEPACILCSGTDDDTKLLLDGESVCPECSRDLNNISRSSRSGSSVPSPAAFSGPSSPAPVLTPFSPLPNGNCIGPGHSSKLDAVVDNLEKYRFGSKRWIRRDTSRRY